MLILAFIGALLVGITLGLFGGGGSILTVPIFVYILNIHPSEATAYSLFVVGVSASVGALKYMRKGLVNYRVSIGFAVPSFLAIFITRKYLMPVLPDTIVQLGDINITSDVLFGLVLILALLLTTFILLKSNLNQKNSGNFIKVLLLLLPAAIMVFVMRQFIIPLIPSNFFYLGDIIVTKRLFIMILFSIVMLYAGFSMISNKEKTKSKPKTPKGHNFTIIVYGLFIGILTGIIGAGGGFLLVPALVFFANLPIRLAIGTSLLIISANSLIGFLGDVTYQKIDWKTLLLFTSISMAGIFIGTYISKFLGSNRLKKGFGYFVLFMSVLVTTIEILKL